MRARECRKPTRVRKGSAAHFSDADKNGARHGSKRLPTASERGLRLREISALSPGWALDRAVEEGTCPCDRLRSSGCRPAQEARPDGRVQEANLRKDPKQALLNAETHLCKIRTIHVRRGVLKNAVKAGYVETAKFVAPVCMDALKAKTSRASRASSRCARPWSRRRRSPRAVAMVDRNAPAQQAVTSLITSWPECPATRSCATSSATGRTPDDLARQIRAGRGFRDSLQDADKQKFCTTRTACRQGEQTLEALIAATRKEWERRPTVPQEARRVRRCASSSRTQAA